MRFRNNKIFQETSFNTHFSLFPLHLSSRYSMLHVSPSSFIRANLNRLCTTRVLSFQSSHNFNPLHPHHRDLRLETLRIPNNSLISIVLACFGDLLNAFPRSWDELYDRSILSARNSKRTRETCGRS